MVEYWKKAAVVLGLGTWSDAMDMMLLGIVSVMLIQEFRLGVYEVTMLTTAFGATAYIFLIGSLMEGLSDYVGRKRLWVLGNFVSGLGYLGCSLAHDWVQVAILRTIGFLGCWSLPLYYIIMSEEMPAHKRQTIVSLARMLSVLAMVNLNILLILSASVPWITWRFMFGYVSIVNIALACAGAIVLREPPVWLERRRLIKEGKIPKEQSVTILTLFKKEYLKKTVIVAVGMLLMLSAGYALGTAGFISLFQVEHLKWDRALIGTLGIITSLIGTLGVMPFIGFLSDKIGRSGVAILGTLIAIIGASLRWWIPAIIPETTSLLAVVMWIVLVTLATFGNQEDTARVWAYENVPATARGAVGAIKTIIINPLSTGLTLLAGSLALAYGLPVVCTIFHIVLGAVALAFFIYARKVGLETKGKELTE
ncbi:MAG: MFS transporter [candidate division WOR-3 bacterium]